jgi:ferredoxin-type protein NapF
LAKENYVSFTETEWGNMGQPISRAQFLRGDFRGERRAERPPWSLTEQAFVTACTRCGDCIRACETRVLQVARGGYPVVDFANGECTFCGACAAVCSSGAIQRTASTPPWNKVAKIGDACLTLRGVVCRTCGENCETGAIRFRLAPRSVAAATLDTSACNGCGACVAPCPVNAVTVQSTTPPEEAAA